MSFGFLVAILADVDKPFSCILHWPFLPPPSHLFKAAEEAKRLTQFSTDNTEDVHGSTDTVEEMSPLCRWQSIKPISNLNLKPLEEVALL